MPVPLPVQHDHGVAFAVHVALLESANVGVRPVVLSTTQTMTASLTVVSCAGLQAIVLVLVADVATQTVLITSATVAVGVGLLVAVPVGLFVGVTLCVWLGVGVAVAVEVGVGVDVGELVGVQVAVPLGVGVPLGV